jgi:hypothetical protein
MIGKMRWWWIRVFVLAIATFCLSVQTCSSALALAAAPEVLVQASRTQIAVGETLRLTVVLKNVDRSKFEPRLPPGLAIEGQNSQTSVSYSTSGGMERITRLIFQVRAQQKGQFSVGPFSVKSDGKTFTSNVLMIAVQDVPTSNPKISQNGVGKSSKDANKAADVFLLSEVARKEVWVGEPFELTLKFYFRVPVSGSSILEADLSQFQSFDGKEVPQQEREEVLNGVKYQVLEVRRQYAAKSAGSITIPQLRIETQVSASRRQPNDDASSDDPFASFSGAFEDPFFARKERKVVASAAIPMLVKPLPEPKPEGFTGVVGDVSFTADLSKKNLAVGENATITMRVEGSADLSATTLPEGPAVDGLKFYPDKPILEQGRDAQGKFFQRKTFKIGVVPTRAGQFEIPARRLFVFRSEQGRYEEKTVTGFSLRAEGAVDASVGSSLASPIAHSVQETGQDILPPKADWTQLSTDMRLSAAHILMWWGSAITFLALSMLMAFRDFLGNRSALLSPEFVSRRARSNFAREIVKLRKDYPQGGDVPEAQLVRTIRNFVGEKFASSANAMTSEELSEFLSSRGISESAVSDMVALVSILDTGRYAGKEDRPPWLELLAAAERGVTRIAKEARV